MIGIPEGEKDKMEARTDKEWKETFLALMAW